MIFKCLLCLFSSLLCLPPAYAQSNGKLPARGALYKISDGRHTLHLFGTIHVGKPDFYPLEARVMQALQQAPVIALELNPNDGKGLQDAMLRHGLYPDGQSFRDTLPPPVTQSLLAALAQYKIPVANVERFRPWLLATTLTVEEYAANGYQTSSAIDIYLAGYMRQRGKPVIELESAEQQMTLFSQLSDEEESRFLSDTLDELNDPGSRRKLLELIELWRTADSKALAALLLDMDKSFADRFTRRVLLDQRNPLLAEGIARLLKQQDKAFAAIGILHLVGPQGVPELLRQRGYQVEQIY
ncbi:TraB/GumN family protein [Herbaspirillum lusitanum]|uniref:TraB/GumN family protein n=1 Tax=Herbaspirillum lusitanum TaxID=213312 RepID=A0ABW9A750_9BURK